MQALTQVYRSTKKEGVYLYVAKDTNLNELPVQLKTIFGDGELAMTLLLTADKVLASTTGDAVLKAIAEQGFYLQLPPKPDRGMQELATNNAKLSER